MAKIFNPPHTIPVPNWDFQKPVAENRKAEEQYTEALKEFLKEKKGW